VDDVVSHSYSRKPLRLWPGIIVAALLVLFHVAVPLLGPAGPPFRFLGGLVGGLLILLWWLLFSRAPWSERLSAIALIAVATLVAWRFLDVSLGQSDRGPLFPILAIPATSAALVAWAVATARLSDGVRRASMIATIVVATFAWTLVRIDGFTGDGSVELRWRWAPTPEDRLLAIHTPTPAVATTKAEPPAPASTRTPPAERPTVAAGVGRSGTPDAPSVPAAGDPKLAPVEWPGFRGPARDGVVRGLKIATDWATSPPAEIWRRPIGPGWSSFAVHGDRFYTQEQRGDDEVVASYSLRNGEPIWQHRDAARFWETAGGAGPRGTPALSNGRVYTFGATGILNALDAENGAVVWSRNAATDTGAPDPGWGFTSSPLVVNGIVIVAASGRLAGYDAATGERRWLGPEGGAGYSSPHLFTIDGVPQVLLLRGARTTSVSPADGTMLWEHRWVPNASIVQPALASNGDVLIAAGDAMAGIGIRRISVKRGPTGWMIEERWTSRGLKPFYNDYVVHQDHAFGFDGNILACIDLADGNRKWKGGRYGYGQMMLLPEQDLLLVVSEEGEIALVKAMPDRFTEVTRFKAIEGKTWNHPALVGDLLLVRNGEEMAAFRLARAGAGVRQ
jgi:outer membrane protein assembly factor BamB